MPLSLYEGPVSLLPLNDILFLFLELAKGIFRFTSFLLLAINQLHLPSYFTFYDNPLFILLPTTSSCSHLLIFLSSLLLLLNGLPSTFTFSSFSSFFDLIEVVLHAFLLSFLCILLTLVRMNFRRTKVKGNKCSFYMFILYLFHIEHLLDSTVSSIDFFLVALNHS